MKRRKRVLLVCDTIGNTPRDYDVQTLLKTPDWQTERDCYTALKRLGYTTDVIAVYDDIMPLIAKVKTFRPDIIFNQVEHFRGISTYERNLVALYELLGIAYTGSNPTGMILCKNKAVTKEVLFARGMCVPRFVVVKKNETVKKNTSILYPAIVKPLRDESSYGISRSSIVTHAAELKDRLAYIHERLDQDAIVEEYIAGDELYVSVLGNERLRVFPVRQLFFGTQKKRPTIATYKIKWDAAYRKKWNISYGFAHLPVRLTREIAATVKDAYKALRIDGYARFDIRLDRDKRIYIIEANPNPCLARNEEFSLSAKKAGIPYEKVIDLIINAGHASYRKIHSFSIDS